MSIRGIIVTIREVSTLAFLMAVLSAAVPMSSVAVGEGPLPALTNGKNAELPAGLAVTWGKEPVEEQGPHRAVVCLNGLWHFQPARGSSVQTPQETGWGWIRVPDCWFNSGYGAFQGVTKAATGLSWEGFNGRTQPAAWYERDLTIPAAWSGRAILLDLRRVSTDAAVFIDGREMGRVSWPGGEVDLTAAVEAGKTHRLLVKVVALADAGEVTRYMGTGEGQISKQQAQLTTRGLIGDVLLASRPRGARLAGCAVRTSVRDHKLAVEAGYDGLKAAGTIALNAVVRDAKGVDAKRFSANVAAVAGAGTLAAAWDWADPQLWDVGAPNLYTLELSAQGTGLDDALLEPFGFREFRIEGKRFLLNEKELRLRTTTMNAEGDVNGDRVLMASFFAGSRANGFNFGELWPWDRNERGRQEYDDLWCAEADRCGFLLIMPAMDQTQLVGDWAKPGVADTWAARMTPALKRLYNHPSVAMWVTGANRFGYGQDQNPQVVGNHDRAWLADANWRRGADYGLDAIRRIKQVDPTRPVLMHAGGAVGDVYTANNYLCLTPLQEREEWLSQWVKDGDMPVLMVEFGTPLAASFHRGRRECGMAEGSEPLYSEYCAIYEGADAYRAETPAYRKMLAVQQGWHHINAEQLHPGYLQLQALFLRNTWRSWRTWGITGGMEPWSKMGWQIDDRAEPYRPAAIAMGLKPRPRVTLPAFEPGLRGVWHASADASVAHYLQPEGMIPTIASEALSSANQETLAWIAGAPDFVDKTHHYRAGEKVAKQLALLNDSRSPQHFNAVWQVEINGARVADGQQEGELALATTKLLPVEFKLPAKIASDSVNGVIRLECTIGAAKHTDSFAFRVFRPAKGKLPAVALLDPRGDTAALLKSLGVRVKPWDGEPTDRLVVVGRNAFVTGGCDPAGLERQLKAGGRVLLMAQEPDWLRDRLGLRVARQLTRRAYPVIADHPALAGLDAEAFRDWAGESRLVAPIEAPYSNGRPPPYGWRWGSRHAVSSAAIEIPHHAGWRPILACEFDGAYTPLAELAVAGGAITVCTLDLEDHAVADPVAERVARAVLASAAAVRLEKREAAVYLGGEAGTGALDTAGITYQRATALPKRGTVAIGPDAAVSDSELEAFLRRGGRALVLPRAVAEAPLGVKLTHADKHPGSLAVPAWASCRGIWPGELRRRVDGMAWTISGGCDEVGADGLLGEVRRGDGVAVFCQLDTGMLDADRLTYNRFTRWRWTRALNQLASNLGIACIGDDRLLHPLPLKEQMLAPPPVSLYHADYRRDFNLGDDPYRYCRW